ncbi:MAG: DUF882 domain-containing protein [Pseudomonadota bacterium]
MFKFQMFKTYAITLMIVFVALSVANAEEKKGDGKLALYSYQINEYIEVVYRTDKGYDKQGLEKIYQAMRSPDGKVFPISIKLIELLDNIADHFKVETVEIISGYRSPNYNKNLSQNGRKVANESLHTKGLAADIHLDEITEKAVQEYALSLNQGGVGFYPNYDFVHIDVGPARAWEENESSTRKLVGAEANINAAWTAITDKNVYFKDEPIKVTIANTTYEKARLIKNVWYEFFRKGKWNKHEKIEAIKGRAALKPGQSTSFTWQPKDMPYGKYRLVIFASKDFNVPPVVSNEFYVKKETISN